MGLRDETGTPRTRHQIRKRALRCPMTGVAVSVEDEALPGCRPCGVIDRIRLERWLPEQGSNLRQFD
jgi:hypothetical protein